MSNLKIQLISMFGANIALNFLLSPDSYSLLHLEIQSIKNPNLNSVKLNY